MIKLNEGTRTPKKADIMTEYHDRDFNLSNDKYILLSRRKKFDTFKNKELFSQWLLDNKAYDDNCDKNNTQITNINTNNERKHTYIESPINQEIINMKDNELYYGNDFNMIQNNYSPCVDKGNCSSKFTRVYLNCNKNKNIYPELKSEKTNIKKQMITLKKKS